ncbi:hypothetical protein PoB_002276200 [Plakobranchus ocellatus]|uniref:CUB domain-containing protein n=1 Tax=Plakobranchus ocellatus TaxID=259542 RepID=A0AAV3ZM20_9GAST|nr:hypothetical protein PoB_002276200 [Plakobranchus ocellatus]
MVEKTLKKTKKPPVRILAVSKSSPCPYYSLDIRSYVKIEITGKNKTALHSSNGSAPQRYFPPTDRPHSVTLLQRTGPKTPAGFFVNIIFIDSDI